MSALYHCHNYRAITFVARLDKITARITGTKSAQSNCVFMNLDKHSSNSISVDPYLSSEHEISFWVSKFFSLLYRENEILK